MKRNITGGIVGILAVVVLLLSVATTVIVLRENANLRTEIKVREGMTQMYLPVPEKVEAYAVRRALVGSTSFSYELIDPYKTIDGRTVYVASVTIDPDPQIGLVQETRLLFGGVPR